MNRDTSTLMFTGPIDMPLRAKSDGGGHPGDGKRASMDRSLPTTRGESMSSLTLLSRSRSDRHLSRALTLLLLVGAAAASVSPSPASAQAPTQTAPRASPQESRGPGFVNYDVRLTADDTGGSWHGGMSVRFVNTTGVVLDTIWLRLWGNGEDGCAAPAVRVTRLSGGTAGDPAVGCTALPVRMAHPLRPGQPALVRFDLHIAVPDRDARFGHNGPYYLLGHALPVLAVHDGKGWHLDSYSTGGESNFSLTADWTVRLDHPRALAIPATGSAVARPARPGRTLTTIAAKRVRDFAFAAGPFGKREALTRHGVLVRLWFADDVSAAEVDDTLSGAVEYMDTFAGWFGRYPYPEVDLVSSHFDWGSMEYPTYVATYPARTAVAHELAHQWWYGLVGNDQYADPWLDEAIAEYAKQRATGDENPLCADPFWPSPDAKVTSGMDYFNANGGYSLVVYLLGSCLMHDLERTMGPDRWLAFLRDYATAHRYGVSTPVAFRAEAQAASPVDLAPVFHRWRAS
ncbi:M1 family metallopeptidase [Micromonospora musae]|nr:M1 family metallopeptidase [Micromonospora musae]